MSEEKLHLAGYVSGPRTRKSLLGLGKPVSDIYTISPQLYEPEKEEPIGIFEDLEYLTDVGKRPTASELIEFLSTDFIGDGFFVSHSSPSIPRGVCLPPPYFEIHVFDEDGKEWK